MQSLSNSDCYCSSCCCSCAAWFSPLSPSLRHNFWIASINSESPRRIIVSTQPLSALHIGQVFVIESIPEYHVFTHDWHPSMFLQHLVAITGGLIGTEWHIWHLNVSLITLLSPNGIAASFVKDITSDTVSLTDATSSVRDWRILPNRPCFALGGRNSLSSSSDESVIVNLLGRFDLELVADWMSP